ncbi:MAG: DNA repair protein RecN [candidate division Zixibacteria bacterium]|nr:DNA repair protein RecN [candidate division Zixibacteria bacterium]
MLKNLRIRNYALVEDLEVEFHPGLNVLTGATGAGKSIILGAVNLILGERASSDVVRSGFDTAIVGATFEPKSDHVLKNLLIQLGINCPDHQDPADNALIIRREVSSKGVSRCFVNDRQVTLRTLKLIGDRLADLHGQHEHQSLLNVARHVEYLDNFGNLNDFLASVSENYHRLKEKQKQLEEQKKSRKLDQERKALYDFQIKEIEKANLSSGEEERLIQDKKILENTEELYRLSSSVYQNLYEGEGSIQERLSISSKEMKRGNELDSRLKEPAENLDSCMIQLQELSRFLEGYKDLLEFDPEKLEMIRERLNLIKSLKKKYGNTIDEILTYAQKIKEDLNKIENKDQIVDELKKEIKKLSDIFKKDCLLLSQKRKTKAFDLAKKIQSTLSGLGMDKTKFEVQITSREDENGLLEIDGRRYFADEKGMDRVEFFVSPNPGEELKPLAKIASGGEISRIMLGLKSILAKADQVSTMIFDEIDVGIGGEVASAVGKSLKNLSSSHQVIVITHLQQIASQANHHFKVFKESLKGRTVTKIRELKEGERVAEIARMISGEKIGELALKQAFEMIKTTNNRSTDSS